jgi:hypothetical protein
MAPYEGDEKERSGIVQRLFSTDRFAVLAQLSYGSTSLLWMTADFARRENGVTRINAVPHCTAADAE